MHVSSPISIKFSHQVEYQSESIQAESIIKILRLKAMVAEVIILPELILPEQLEEGMVIVFIIEDTDAFGIYIVIV